MKLYLAHPFDSRQLIREWELEFEARSGIELCNPFYDAPDRTDIEEIDAGRAERYEKLIPSDLVRRDLRYMLACDGLIAIIDGSVSYGTIMEIVYANMFRLPVGMVVTNGHVNHPWLREHSSFIFTSFDEFELFCMRGEWQGL